MSNIRNIIARYGIYWVLLLVTIVASILSPDFLTLKNIPNVLRVASILGIVSIGQTFVILMAGIDLSVPSVLSLSTVLVGNLMGFKNEMIFPLLILVLGIGALIGLANGICITKLNVPDIVATLGMMFLVQGVGLLYSKGIPQNTLTPMFRILGEGYLAFLPIPVIVFGTVLAIGLILLYFTKLGRHIYAGGGNPIAAHFSGINVNLVKTLTYIISGITAALAGYVLVARLGVGDNWVGVQEYLLESIMVVVIGGTSLFGGRGGLLGTTAAVLVLAILYNLLLLLGISFFWQEIVRGSVIIGAVLLYSKKIET